MPTTQSPGLVLRPLNLGFPVDLIEIGPDASPGEFIAGRVVLDDQRTVNVGLDRPAKAVDSNVVGNIGIVEARELGDEVQMHTPVGPLRCLAMMISDLALSDSDISSSRL